MENKDVFKILEELDRDTQPDYRALYQDLLFKNANLTKLLEEKTKDATYFKDLSAKLITERNELKESILNFKSAIGDFDKLLKD